MPDLIQQIDEKVVSWLQAHHTPWLDYNMQQVVTLGSTTVIALLALFAAGLLLMERECVKVALVLLLPVGAYFASGAIKDFVGRPRPKVGDPPKALSNSASFPSGHSSLATTGFLVTALALKELWRRVGVWAYPYVVAWAVTLAGMIGMSRVYFGYHYLSDVIGGSLLGLALGGVFVGVTRMTARRRTGTVQDSAA